MTASDAGARELEAARAHADWLRGIQKRRVELEAQADKGRAGNSNWGRLLDEIDGLRDYDIAIELLPYIDSLEARLHATERELASARAANDVAAPILSVFKAHQQSWQEAGFGTSSLHDFLFEWADTTWLSENLVALLSTFMREPAANAEPTAPLLAADAPAEGDA